MESNKAENQEGQARPRSGTASKAGGGASTGSGAAERGGEAPMTFAEFRDELLAAYGSPGDVLDLGGRSVYLASGQTALPVRNMTIANCTFKSNVVCQMIEGWTPENVKFINVKFAGGARGNCRDTPLADASETVTVCGMVHLVGVHGISFENCTFRNAAPCEGGKERLAMGLCVVDSTVQIDNCRFVNNMGNGLLASGSTTVVVVNNSEFAGNHMFGVQAAEQACVDIAGSQLHGNGGGGMTASGGHVRATNTACTGNLSDGASASAAGGKLTLDRCRMIDNAHYGVRAAGEGIEVMATDLTCSRGDTVPPADPGKEIAGVEVSDGAHCTVRGGAMTGFSTGLLVVDCGSRLTASDVVCSDNGVGAMCTLGGSGALQLTRATLRTNHVAGILAFCGGTVTAVDSQVHQNAVYGVRAIGNVRVTLEGCCISGSRDSVNASALWSLDGFSDIMPSDARSDAAAKGGAEVVMQGGSVKDIRRLAFVAEGKGTIVTLMDVGGGKVQAAARGGARIIMNGRAICG